MCIDDVTLIDQQPEDDKEEHRNSTTTVVITPAQLQPTMTNPNGKVSYSIDIET